MTTQTTSQKSSIKRRLRTDLGRSVGVTTAIQLVWLTWFTGPPSHSPQQPCNQKDTTLYFQSSFNFLLKMNNVLRFEHLTRSSARMNIHCYNVIYAKFRNLTYTNTVHSFEFAQSCIRPSQIWDRFAQSWVQPLQFSYIVLKILFN